MNLASGHHIEQWKLGVPLSSLFFFCFLHGVLFSHLRLQFWGSTLASAFVMLHTFLGCPWDISHSLSPKYNSLSPCVKQLLFRNFFLQLQAVLSSWTPNREPSSTAHLLSSTPIQLIINSCYSYISFSFLFSNHPLYSNYHCILQNHPLLSVFNQHSSSSGILRLESHGELKRWPVPGSMPRNVVLFSTG